MPVGRKGQGRAVLRHTPTVGGPVGAREPIPETVAETTSVTVQDFKATMGRFASGVTVVTTRLGGLRAGLTVNAFCSLSLEPPLVLICVDRASRVHDVLVQAGIFAVNILTAGQEEVSRCFAGQSERRWQDFCDCATHTVATGAPVLDQALGFVDCRVTDVFPGGDHSVIVGRVEALGARAGEPLLYYRGRYLPPKRSSRRAGTPADAAPAGKRASASNGRGTLNMVSGATRGVMDDAPVSDVTTSDAPGRSEG